MTMMPHDPQPIKAAMSEASPRRPGWATAIGIVSLCYGGLGALLRVVMFVLDLFAVASGGEVQVPGLGTAPPWYGVHEAVFNACLVVLGIVLVGGGVALLYRRPSGRLLHIAWAVGILASQVVALVVLMLLPGAQEASGAKQVGMLVGACFVTVIRVAYPVFLLIWFMRRKIRQEMASWRSGPV